MISAPLVTVQGVSWVNAREQGQIRHGRRMPHGGDPATLWKTEPLFARMPKGIGRFDAASKRTYCAVALALDDAGLGDPRALREEMGIVGACRDGSLSSNVKYYKDYVACGRKLARGSLFIYTLPTSSLAESAIHFGLTGPLLYAMCPDRPLAAVLETAAGMIRRGEAAGMLVVLAEGDEAVCLVLSAQAGVEVELALAVARRGTNQAELVDGWTECFRRENREA
jgi:hypothetical protein